MSHALYSAPTVKRAQELWEAGFNQTEIRKLLERETGRTPDWCTIRRWVDPDYREARNLSRVSGRKRSRKLPWSVVRTRLQVLHAEVDLPPASVAKLLHHEFGCSLSAEQVRHIVTDQISERTIARLLTPPKQETSV